MSHKEVKEDEEMRSAKRVEQYIWTKMTHEFEQDVYVIFIIKRKISMSGKTIGIFSHSPWILDISILREGHQWMRQSKTWKESNESETLKGKDEEKKWQELLLEALPVLLVEKEQEETWSRTRASERFFILSSIPRLLLLLVSFPFRNPIYFKLRQRHGQFLLCSHGFSNCDLRWRVVTAGSPVTYSSNKLDKHDRPTQDWSLRGLVINFILQSFCRKAFNWMMEWSMTTQSLYSSLFTSYRVE
jgi:hypothetical protein